MLNQWLAVWDLVGSISMRLRLRSCGKTGLLAAPPGIVPV